MTDPLSWSISLGRWGGSRVRVHVLLLLFAAGKLLESIWAKDRPHSTLETVAWLGLLFVALLARQLAQAAMAARLDVNQDEIRLWPAGQLGGPMLSASERPAEGVIVVLAGLLTNLALALAIAAGMEIARREHGV